MDLSKIGIYEVDGERVAFKPTDLEIRAGEPTRMTGVIMDIFKTSNNLIRKANVIEKVIFNAPATVVIWGDKTKTVVKCQEGDTYDREKGLALCIAKKFLGNKSNFNEVFKKWIPEEPTEVKKKEEISVEKMRAKLFRFCEGDPGCGECDLRKFCEKNNHDFLSRYHGEYVVSDDKIREAYNIVFGIKNEM